MSKLSHRKWRALIKSKKRKLKRQTLAQLSEHLCDNDDENAEEDDAENQQAKIIEDQEVQERYVQHLLWMERERMALAIFDAKKAREVKERQRREEEERLIKEEWEERQKKEKEEEEQRKKSEQERKSRQDELLKQATANERKGNQDGSWHNPIAPAGYSTEAQERPVCEFFSKIGVCRFRDRCSRSHNVSIDDSCTLLFPGMYSHFEFDQSMRDEYDTDITLEFEDSDIYQHFESFYFDVVPEFKAVGRVVQFKVCCNYEPHLRGNVYVQYHSHKEALEAYAKFNGRWYAGKQLSCQFTCVNRWKQAICGLFHQRKCPKGRHCNFMHVFCNPGNEFHEADVDIFRLGSSSRRENRVILHDRTPEIRWDRQSQSRRSFRSEYSRTRHARSRSRSRSRRSRQSRSPSRHRRRSPERSPSNNGHHRSSRSPSRRRRHRNSAEQPRSSHVSRSASVRSDFQHIPSCESHDDDVDRRRNCNDSDKSDLTVECELDKSKTVQVVVEVCPAESTDKTERASNISDSCDRVVLVDDDVDVDQSENSDEEKCSLGVSESTEETNLESQKKRHHKKHKSRKHRKHKSDRSRNI